MPNIPGINESVLPGVFARDRVITRGVSVPGGTRVVCVMGEGLREETIVSSARGGGLDGNSSCSPTGRGDGRYFRLSTYPVVSGRTQLFLNGTELYGIQDEVDETSFDGKFDFRIDPKTGCIELQATSIGDQDGKRYSASSLNIGNGILATGACGDLNILDVIDPSAPPERWTVRAVSVIRDSNGDPIPGMTTFTVTGSVSGQIKNSNGQPILFSSSYKTGSSGAISGTADPCVDGFTVASSADFSTGDAVLDPADGTPQTTRLFEFTGNLLAQGQALIGDELCVAGENGIEIEDISYDSGTGKTTITLVTDSLDASLANVAWDIKATNVFIDDPSVTHDGTTGVPLSEGMFTGADVGKIVAICGGDAAGLYTITQVTSSRRVRIERFEDPLEALPSLVDGNNDGLFDTGLTFHILQSNGVLLLGIKEGSVPFEVGDKFFIDVNSRVLKKNDTLEARYIAESDINDPELFASPQDLMVKHGSPSLESPLSLGAQLAFENGAPAVLALQTKPDLPRRSMVTLIEEENRSGEGGFRACGGSAGDCEVDDLMFIIPRPLSGLLAGRPDGDTQVGIFVVRDGEERQIFPNRVPFYNTQFESPTGQNQFITGSSTSYSYTVINTDVKIEGTGDDGIVTSADGSFSTASYDFDADDVGKIIVVQSLETTTSTVYTTEEDIATYLFGSSSAGVELIITGITSDNKVTAVANDGNSTVITADAVEVQFFVKDTSDTTNVSAALLLHKDLVSSGTLKAGDGIKISYVDENDAEFYDSNWFEAFESLETEDCQIVVPLPRQNRSGIFRAAINHVNTMSSITIQKERMAIIGAQRGVTVDALIGLKEVAVENLGVVEGIQGDDPEEVLNGDVEDLANYRLTSNYNEKRLMYIAPDEIIKEVQGTNVVLDGFYAATAVGGWFSGNQNLAEPITNKTLTGFTIARNRKYRPEVLRQLNAEGATILQPVAGGAKVLVGKTTAQSGYAEDEEPSIIFIRDFVKKALREQIAPYIGSAENPNTQGIMGSVVRKTMTSLVSKELITDFTGIRVARDKVEPRQWNVYVRFQPVYPINWAYIDIEVGVL